LEKKKKITKSAGGVAQGEGSLPLPSKKKTEKEEKGV
jgi:hypothetical protein